jgi:excisionase family DNA binding protein
MPDAFTGFVMQLKKHFARMEILAVLATGVIDSFSTEEVAALFGVTPDTVRTWCRTGEMRGEKCGARCGGEHEWRVTRDELLRYKSKGKLPAGQTNQKIQVSS